MPKTSEELLKERASARRKISKKDDEENIHMALDMVDRFITAVERIAEALERR